MLRKRVQDLVGLARTDSALKALGEFKNLPKHHRITRRILNKRYVDIMTRQIRGTLKGEDALAEMAHLQSSILEFIKLIK